MRAPTLALLLVTDRTATWNDAEPVTTGDAFIECDPSGSARQPIA